MNARVISTDNCETVQRWRSLSNAVTGDRTQRSSTTATHLTTSVSYNKVYMAYIYIHWLQYNSTCSAIKLSKYGLTATGHIIGHFRLRTKYFRQGRIQRGARGAMSPNRRLSGFFTGKNRLCWDCSLYQKCSVDLKYAKNALAAGAPPRTPLGEFTTLPQTP